MMVRLWIIASSEDRDPTRTTEGRESDVAVQKTQQKTSNRMYYWVQC